MHYSKAERAADGATPWRRLARHDDSFEYLQLSDGIRHGCGFARLVADRCRAPEIVRTPGYPLFLAMTPTVRWALALQAIMGGMGCLVLALCIEAAWGIGPALTAEALIAFDVPSFTLANQVMSEALFAVCLLLATIPALLAIRKPRHALALVGFSGFFAAFAVLVRPIGILLPLFGASPFLFLRDVTWKRRTVLSCVAFALPALTIVGWSVRNYEVSGYPGFSTIGSINLYFYRAANVVARERQEGLEAMRGEFENRLGVPFEAVYASQSAEVARRLKQLAVPILLAHPLETAAMTFQSTIYLAISPLRAQLANVIGIFDGPPRLGLSSGAPSARRAWGVIHSLSQSPPLAALAILQIFMIAILWTGLLRALLRCRKASPEYRLWVLYLGGLSILLLVLAAGGEADVRFRVPVLPLLATVAALGLFAKNTGLRHEDAN